MRWLLVLLFFVPFVSSLGIDIDYPHEILSGEDVLVDVKLINGSGVFYDLKIDVILNDKRVSRIKENSEYKSSMYYLNDAISDSGEFYIKIFEGVGDAELIVKIRDNTGSVMTFDGYEIRVLNSESKVLDEGKEDEKGEDSKKKEKEENQDEKESKESYYKTENEGKKIISSLNNIENEPKIINLNPKTIKKDENLEDKKSRVGKYSIVLFSLLLLLLYTIKFNKKERKNEFRY